MDFKQKILRRKYILISLFFSLHVLAYSQENVQYKTIEALIDSSYHEFNKLNLVSSIQIANQALLKSRKDEYEKGAAWSLFYIGQSLHELIEYRKALEYLSMAEHIPYTKTDAYLQSEIYRVRSRLYGNTLLYEKSIQEQLKGIKLISKTDKSLREKEYLKSLAYDNLATTYNLSKKQTHLIFI